MLMLFFIRSGWSWWSFMFIFFFVIIFIRSWWPFMFMLLFIDDFANSGFMSQFPKAQSVLYAFAAQPRFAYFSEGFIRLSDLTFFASAVIVLLIWTYIAIEKRRWNRG